ncbi:MAG: hypothetical protein U1E35_06955 [Rhodospirillales bacterium]
MLTIARTLMGNPRVIMLDEPSEGLAPLIVERMAVAVAEMKREGLAVLLAEQESGLRPRRQRPGDDHREGANCFRRHPRHAACRRDGGAGVSRGVTGESCRRSCFPACARSCKGDAIAMID